MKWKKLPEKCPKSGWYWLRWCDALSNGENDIALINDYEKVFVYSERFFDTSWTELWMDEESCRSAEIAGPINPPRRDKK